MTKKIINIGVAANDRGGDPIRLAFQKVNDNFTELYTGLPLLSVGPLPPDGPHTVGEQWWDSTDGNSYIWYDDAWIPSTASVSDQTKNVRTNTGNSINIDFQADGVITTTQTTDINIAFSNYTVGSRVKVVVATSSSSFKVNLGVLATKSSNGTTVARASTVPSTIMLEYVCTTTQASGVYVTVISTFPISPIPTHSYGIVGDTAGMMAFDATYIYYCTADYVNTSTNIWKRTAHGTGTW